MKHFHEKQTKILEFLLQHPEGVTLSDLSLHLGITKTATKEHIGRITHLGLVIHRDVRASVGRPKRHYLLSSDGKEAFPRQYSWLSLALLEHLGDELGSSGLTRMMKNLAKKIAKEMAPRFNGKSGAESIKEVEKVMNELGYRSRIVQTDLRKGAVLEATNCVYHHLAIKHPELCSFDVEFVESSTGLKAELQSCIAKGGQSCRFCLTKK